MEFVTNATNKHNINIAVVPYLEEQNIKQSGITGWPGSKNVKYIFSPMLRIDMHYGGTAKRSFMVTELVCGNRSWSTTKMRKSDRGKKGKEYLRKTLM